MTSNRIDRFFRRWLVVLCAIVLAASGCGGGGGSSSSSPSSSSTATSQDYTLIERAAGQIGPEPSSITYNDVALEASLASEQTVTITEKFYSANRPAGIIGTVYDIQPDGLQFLSGTRFCISFSGTGYTADQITIVTGANLDQPLDSYVNTLNGRLCTNLSHSSPYSLARVQGLEIPEYTIFGSLDAKDKYRYKVTTSSETHSQFGPLTKVNIQVFCNLQCMEGGEREFWVFSTGSSAGDDTTVFDTRPGDMYIIDNGNYALWRDFDGMPWVRFTSSDGTVMAGIAYLMASEYMSYFGSNPAASYASQLDPDENRIQRFFYEAGTVTSYGYTEIVRSESEFPGKIKILVTKEGTVDKHFVIDKSTVEITKSWISPATLKEVVETAAPGDSAYDTLNMELLYYINEVVGIDDTPDETAGNPYDEFTRLTPNQELFAVNVMNLLKGLGWNSLEGIEAYYRDRLDLWSQ